MIGTGTDALGAYVTLRNPWGTDAGPEQFTGLAPAVRAVFTQGDEADGVVRVSWEVFKQGCGAFRGATG